MSDKHNSEDDGSRPEHLKRFESRIKRLEAETGLVREYGTVLVWHRWVDENLTESLRGIFHPPKSAADSLLNYPGGLSSFSARMHLGKCIGLYGPVTYGDLQVINRIRNEFAHPRYGKNTDGDLEILGFDDPRISELCYSLAFLDSSVLPRAVEISAEEKYCSVCQHIAVAIWAIAHGGGLYIFDDPKKLP